MRGITEREITKWKECIHVREQEDGQMEVCFHMKPEQLAILKEIYIQSNFEEPERLVELVFQFGSTVTARDYLGRGCFLGMVSVIRGIMRKEKK